MNPLNGKSFRIPRWVIILGTVGLVLVSLAVVGLGILAFQVGSQIVAVAKDAPAYISEQAEKAASDPRIASALKRKLACVDLVGGPSANAAFTHAIDAAPTEEIRTRIKSFGESVGLPRPTETPAGTLFSHCVWGSPTST